MRVLHLDTELTWRGGENQIRLLVEGLSRSGVHNVVVARPGSLLAQRLPSVALVEELPMRGGFDLVAARRLASIFRRHDIDLVDAHTSNAHLLGLLALWRRPRPGFVVHRRVDYRPGAGALNRLKYQSRRVDRYVAISGAIRQILIEWGLAADRIRVVKSAIDPSPYRELDRSQCRAQLAQSSGVDPAKVFIGNAAAMTHQKGYETLIAALARLRATQVPFHAFVAGDGPLKDEILGNARRLGLDGHLTYLGFVNTVPAFLSGLDILAMPSNFEGLGTLLFEAAYAGCAIAATDVGGIPEVITHGVSGLLSPVGDAALLAEHLRRLVADGALRHRLAEAVNLHVRREFSVDAMVTGNLEVYRELLVKARC